MNNVIEFVTANWDGILAVIAGVHVLALAIVNLTPTPKDNEIVAKAYKVVEVVAGLFSAKVKQ
jgi:hypothetical protein